MEIWDLPAAGGNFANFEVEITKNGVKSGNFSACGTIFMKMFVYFHRFGWKNRAEGAKKIWVEILELILAQGGNFWRKSRVDFFRLQKKNSTLPPHNLGL